MAGLWAHYISGFFIRAYKERAKGTVLIPSSVFDLETLLQYFVVQKAMMIFNGYLKKDPRRVIIAQAMLREVLQPQAEEVVVATAGPGDAPTAAAETGNAAAAGTGAAGYGVAAAGAGGVAVAPAETVAEPKPADVEAEKVVQH
jgi:hypothetical protein